MLRRQKLQLTVNKDLFKKFNFCFFSDDDEELKRIQSAAVTFDFVMKDSAIPTNTEIIGKYFQK